MSLSFGGGRKVVYYLGTQIHKESKGNVVLVTKNLAKERLQLAGILS